MLDSPTSMASIDHSKNVATKSSLRSVKFKETPTLVLLPDDADTKAARRGPWEMLARDRARFKRRIKQTEDAISWIFEQTHRDQARARLATGRIDCTECHPVGHDASASTSMDRVRYESEIHRKLYQNDHPFVLRKYDGRMKKCRGCCKAFKSVGIDRPKFVVATRSSTCTDAPTRLNACSWRSVTSFTTTTWRVYYRVILTTMTVTL